MRFCTLFVWAAAVSFVSLKAQVGLELPEIKPGAYHSEKPTIAFRAECFPATFISVIPSADDGITGMGILGFGIGLKFPVPERRSQIIPTAGINFGAGRYGASRVELSMEWRYFPLGHDKNQKHDWEKPWLGAGANIGHRPINQEGNFYPFHAGVFFKLGMGWIAFFTEFGILPVLSGNVQDTDVFVGIDPNARAFRYGFVFEI